MFADLAGIVYPRLAQWARYRFRRNNSVYRIAGNQLHGPNLPTGESK